MTKEEAKKFAVKIIEGVVLNHKELLEGKTSSGKLAKDDEKFLFHVLQGIIETINQIMDSLRNADTN